MPDPIPHPDRNPTNDPLATVDPLPTAADTIDLATNRQQSQSTLDRPGHIPSRSASSDLPVISGYLITGEIARGGMGQVYAARDLTLDREVAIKTLLPTANVDRFLVESKITAKLPHPGIPPVHALGTLADGAPYLAMKLIRGRTLAELLKDRSSPQVDLPRFLQIFEQIAQAVGFAHAQGIIHRDLKPANVMVGAFGEVQVMDWGLAKEMRNGEGRALNEPAAPTSLTAGSAIRHPQSALEFTETGSVFGTPGYMSPEQARGEAVDTRTDVFALGSILAAILTGQPAFVGKTVAEIMRQAIARDLTDVLGRLEACGADADLIGLAQRYLSADAIHRPDNAQLVAGEIADHRASVEQRLRRAETQAAEALVREAEVRKRRNVWLGLASVLLIGVIVSSGLAWWANRSRQDAVLARAKEAQRANSENKARMEEKKAKEETQRRLEQIRKGNKIVNSIFSDLDIRRIKNGAQPLEAVLGQQLIKAGEELQNESIGDALVVAELQNSLANSLVNLGHAEPAIKLLIKARATFHDHLGPDHPDTLNATACLAGAYAAAGQFEPAIALLEDTVRRGPTAGEKYNLTLAAMHDLADVYQRADMLERALPLFEETLKLSKAQKGSDHLDTVRTAFCLGGAYLVDGKYDLALPLLEQSLEQLQGRLPPDHPDVLAAETNLISAYGATGKIELLIPKLQSILALERQKLGADHPIVLTTTINLATFHKEAGNFEVALSLFQKVLAARKAQLRPGHPDILESMKDLAECYQAAGDLVLALPLLEEVLKQQKLMFGDDHATTLATVSALGEYYFAAGKFDLALPILEKDLELKKTKFGEDHPNTLSSMGSLATCYLKVGKRALAIPLFEETLQKETAKLGDQHPSTLKSANSLAMAYSEVGKSDLAIPLLKETLRIQTAKLGEDHPDTLASLGNLGNCYLAAQKPELALPLFEDTLKLRKAKLGSDHPDTLHAMSDLAACYLAGGIHAPAVPLLEEALRQMKVKQGAEHPSTVITMNNLAMAYYSTGKPDLALPLYEQTVNLFKMQLGADHPNTIRQLKNAGMAFGEAGKGEQAAIYLKEFIDQSRKQPMSKREFAGLLGLVCTALEKWGQLPASEGMLRELCEIRLELDPDSFVPFWVQSVLGEALLVQKKYKDAEPELLMGYEGMKAREESIPPFATKRIPEAIDRLIKLYTALDKPDEVKKWQAEREKYPARETPK